MRNLDRKYTLYFPLNYATVYPGIYKFIFAGQIKA